MDRSLPSNHSPSPEIPAVSRTDAKPNPPSSASTISRSFNLLTRFLARIPRPRFSSVRAIETQLTSHLKFSPADALPRGVYRRVLAYFRADLKLIVLLLIVIAFSIALSLLQAWPMPVLVDSVLTATPRTDWIHRLFLAPLPETMLGQVIGVTIIGMTMKIVQDTLTLVQVMLRNRIFNYGVMRARNDLYQKLQDLDIGYHQRQGQGEAMYRVCNDAQGIQVILSVLITAFVSAVTLVVMTAIMFSRSVPLTIYALSVTPLMIATNHFFGRRIRRRNVGAKEIDTSMVSMVQRTMGVVGLVQLFGRQPRQSSEFSQTTRKTADVWLKLNWIQEIYWLVVRTIFSLGGAVIFGYGGYLVWRDQFASPISDGMTLGTLMVFMDYLGKMWDPLTKLTGVVADIQPGLAGAQRVFEVLDTASRITDAHDAFSLPVRPRPLEILSAGFHYSHDKPVLDGVSASIAPGQMVAFVGRSGAGKSTLLNLIPRFHDASQGALLLDGIDVRKIRLADLRRHIAIVPQESLILSASVAENIAFGRAGASVAEIRRVAEMAGCHDFISDFPDGYDTLLGESGRQLSGGQRQRLAIARALLTDAPILVFDEPTSALDPHYESLITQTLRALKGRRSIILVSHRLGAMSDCDNIYVLDQGRVAEQGTHDRLLALRGIYHSMVQQQNAPTPAPLAPQDTPPRAAPAERSRAA